MKKVVLISAILLLEIITCVFLNDGWVYLMSSLIAVPLIAAIATSNRWTIKLTRWAKANTAATQVILAVAQLALLLTGIIAGYNFKQLGYEFSNAIPVVFSTVLIVSFLSVPFLFRSRIIAIPKEVTKHRMAFLGIALSSFVLLIVTGNKIEEVYPNSFITGALKEMDQSIFPSNINHYANITNPVLEPSYPEAFNKRAGNNTPVTVFASFSSKEKPATSEKKASKMEKKQLKAMKRLLRHRLGFAAALSVGAVLLLILLIFTSCAGLCLLIAGIVGLGGSATGSAIALLAVGALITFGSVLGIREIFRNKENQ